MRTTFDLVASIYPLLERLSFGDELNRARRAFLESAGQAQQILLVGEGNGRFLRECLLLESDAQITVVDISAQMLASARLVADAAPRRRNAVQLVQADFLSWRGLPKSVDLVYTHFFLDLFLPGSQQCVIDSIRHAVTPEALWVDVDYCCPRARRRDRMIDWLQYRFDHAFCGVETDRHHDPAAGILAEGWRVTGEQMFARGNVVARRHQHPQVSLDSR